MEDISIEKLSKENKEELLISLIQDSEVLLQVFHPKTDCLRNIRKDNVCMNGSFVNVEVESWSSDSDFLSKPDYRGRVHDFAKESIAYARKKHRITEETEWLSKDEKRTLRDTAIDIAFEKVDGNFTHPYCVMMHTGNEDAIFDHGVSHKLNEHRGADNVMYEMAFWAILEDVRERICSILD